MNNHRKAPIARSTAGVPGAACRRVGLMLAVALFQQSISPAAGAGQAPALGSAIFIHPDGSSVSAWSAMRLLAAGPDGTLHWDRLEHVGVYRGHLSNSVASTSQGGGTVHAYGVKVPYEAYGMVDGKPVTSLSGKRLSVLGEAIKAGLSTALINSGHLAEPGTGVFAASAGSRKAIFAITQQIVESGTDIILGGGEALLLPSDAIGRHGTWGLRPDGVNLVERAEALGYTVVYTRDELFDLPAGTAKVLGLFAAVNTFNDRSEQELRVRGLPLYHPTAPTVGEMVEVALRLLEARGERFLMVVEEEGSDNFANHNNARGTLAALARADTAIGVAMGYVAEHPATLLLTAADSDAGGMQVVPARDSTRFGLPLPLITGNGAPLDGRDGTGSLPFVAQPDAAGTRLHFGIAWADVEDLMGGVVARAHGMNAELLPSTVDNTDVYRMLYATLFGQWLN